MRCTMTREQLLSALKSVKGALPSRNRHAVEILSHILIEARQECVRITATDLLMRATCEVGGVQVIEEGRCTVNFHQLEEISRSLPKQARLTLTQQEQSVEIACNGTAYVEGTSAEAFPFPRTLPDPGDIYAETHEEWERDEQGTSQRTFVTCTYEVLQAHRQQLVLPCATLGDLLAKVAFAASGDDPFRPIQHNVCLSLKNDEVTLVAFDAFRLAVRTASVPGSGSWEHDLLIPVDAARKVIKLLPKGEAITVSFVATTDRLIGKNGQAYEAEPFLRPIDVTLAAEMVRVSLRPTQGAFPAYRRMFDGEWKTRVVCETAELLSAVQTVTAVAKENSNLTIFRARAGMLSVEATNGRLLRPTVRDVSAEVTGAQISILLSCQYVLDLLQVTTTPSIALELVSPAKPVVFRPLSDELGTSHYLVMSMALQR